MIKAQSLNEHVKTFRAENNLALDESNSPIWMAQLGHFVIPLPNFKWRREVIDRHDVHHLITGYDTSPSGELQLAAWELGAKCYSSLGAKTLCFLLALMGLATQPYNIISAYKKGCSKATLYKSPPI